MGVRGLCRSLYRYFPSLITKQSTCLIRIAEGRVWVIREPREVLCAFGGPEGLTTVFGQFKGVEQNKIGGKSRNRGEHAEKRDLNRVRLYAPDKGGEIFC